MCITEARHPDVRGFRVPVAGERRLLRLFPDALQQRCVRARISLTRTVSLRDRALVVRILNQATNQGLDFVLSFHSGGTLARRLDDLQRERRANNSLRHTGASATARLYFSRGWENPLGS